MDGAVPITFDCHWKTTILNILIRNVRRYQRVITEACKSTKAQAIVHETMHRKLRLEQNLNTTKAEGELMSSVFGDKS
jgi:hypothetical protein